MLTQVAEGVLVHQGELLQNNTVLRSGVSRFRPLEIAADRRRACMLVPSGLRISPSAGG